MLSLRRGRRAFLLVFEAPGFRGRLLRRGLRLRHRDEISMLPDTRCYDSTWNEAIQDFGRVAAL